MQSSSYLEHPKMVQIPTPRPLTPSHLSIPTAPDSSAGTPTRHVSLHNRIMDYN